MIMAPEQILGRSAQLATNVQIAHEILRHLSQWECTGITAELLNVSFSSPLRDKQRQTTLTGLPGPLNRFSQVDNKTPHLITKAHRQ
ncbi:hypothetical protein [Aeromonas salmonicida]|uniref:hypothetical protein n=1 Tax=Aeromonas TaxID=642 RepID=UPI0012D8BFBF